MVNVTERRKGEFNRRKRERRKNWALTFDQRDETFWRYESLYGRRRESSDQRKGLVNRRRKDRRKGDERRKGERREAAPVQRPAMLSREIPEQVAQVRAVSGGVTVRQRSVRTGVDLSEPTRIYKPPAVSSNANHENPKELSSSPFDPLEETFPGFMEMLRSVARAAKQGWDSLRDKKDD